MIYLRFLKSYHYTRAKGVSFWILLFYRQAERALQKEDLGAFKIGETYRPERDTIEPYLIGGTYKGGGSASVDELNALDGKGTARQLIENGGGTITPYGVVYDNGMKLERVYGGRFFPCYYYEPNAITVAVTSKAEPEDTNHITWLFLPMVQEEIDRALLRGGITDPADVRLRLEDSQFPNEVDVLLDMEYETLSDLNELAEATDGLSKADMEKLGAVVMLAKPKSAAQIKNLAESLDLFDLAPGAHTPQEYGKYMIQQSGRFEYDENLDAFYDYEKYGTERMNEEDGMFTDRGYIAYKGYISIGATNYSQKTIYILEASATLHEFGHFLDWQLGFPAEHEQLYLAEAQNSGLRDYAKTNAREYFADSFDYWITHGSNSEMMEHLRKNAPQTWTCFETLEKNNWSG